jgi:endonuclease YncB( thermonuclease family)
MIKPSLIFLIFLQACSSKPLIFEPASKTNFLCGDSVVWCLDLHRGFKNATVDFILDGDTLSTVKNVYTLENECTEVRLACTRNGSNKNKIFLCNYATKFEKVWEFPDRKLDSVKVDFIVNGDKYTFAFPKYSEYRFYGISAIQPYHQVGYLPSKKCITCF